MFLQVAANLGAVEDERIVTFNNVISMERCAVSYYITYSVRKLRMSSAVRGSHLRRRPAQHSISGADKLSTAILRFVCVKFYIVCREGGKMKQAAVDAEQQVQGGGRHYIFIMNRAGRRPGVEETASLKEMPFVDTPPTWLLYGPVRNYINYLATGFERS